MIAQEDIDPLRAERGALDRVSHIVQFADHFIGGSLLRFWQERSASLRENPTAMLTDELLGEADRKLSDPCGVSLSRFG